jgi:hypothetical protein
LFCRQIKTPSGGIKIYISWKVRNPNAAVFDYLADVNEKMNGVELFIPWNDAAGASNRRKRSTEDITGTVYGSLVGTEQKQNSFVLSYKDSADSADSAASIKAGGLITGILALFVVWLQQQKHA